MSTIQSEQFVNAIISLLDETFNQVHGYFLDKNTSLFETLAGISAEEASIPVGGKCASLAAQVKHISFYLDAIIQMIQNPDFQGVDWGEIWRTVEKVNEEEWDAIKQELSVNYNRILDLVKQTPDWSDERAIGGAIGVITHTAYHLGEIRQALCTLR